MTTGMKTLAKETAIYGGSTILGRLLNWLLGLYWAFELKTIAEMGVITYSYAWTSLFLVILTYGMETGFFRFANREDNPFKVYSTAIISLASTTLLFLVLTIAFLEPIAAVFGPSMKPRYALMLILILSIDVMGAIPFAYLRFARRPIKFAFIKVLNVVLIIIFNLFFFKAVPWLSNYYPDLFAWYDISNGIDYILFSNLLASIIQFTLLIPHLPKKYQFDWALLKRMLKYSYPLLILGAAGMLNQSVDKMVFTWLYPDAAEAETQLGIYGQSFKIAVIMVMFTQAFRYAFEPFIFARDRESSTDTNLKSYADASKYFLILGLLIFLITMGYLDIIKYLIPHNYHEGLKVVPIVMMGELFFGLYFNLSLWYKLTDKTKWGAYMSLFGLVITLTILIVFIPHYGYMASAWASFFANLSMMMVSYFLGQKNYPIPYDLKTALSFTLLAGILGFLMFLNFHYSPNLLVRISLNTLFVLVYLWVTIKKELPLRELPVIGKYFNK
ncbi:MAG TPA: polysaccharide biosynthesis C-terminal domain-containing protein [Dysgonamonadaceae bacterium]|nr:polysaccharide biosynthesis C-terminal domain-containing protein [Dysgonamonadaceae bacterium]